MQDIHLDRKSTPCPGEEAQSRVARGKAEYAEAKVGQVRRKLELGNPWTFMAEDLRANDRCAGYVPRDRKDAVVALIRGNVPVARPRAALVVRPWLPGPIPKPFYLFLVSPGIRLFWVSEWKRGERKECPYSSRTCAGREGWKGGEDVKE